MAAKLFQDVKYHLPSTLPDESQEDLSALLETHGATRVQSVYDETVTHIITNSETFEGWQDVDPELVAIVSELWVERSIAANKLQQPCHYSASQSKIFSGVIACSADLHHSDEEVLSVGITALGGQWRVGLIKDVTHLFAITPTSEKYTTGMSYRAQTHIRVLVPNWFDDSILLGKRDLPTATYEWPDPEVLELRARPRTPTQVKRAQRSSMSPQKRALYTTAAQDDADPVVAGAAWGGRRVAKDVWGGRHVLLSTSLALTGARRRIIENGIRQAQGVPVRYRANGGDGTPEEERRLLARCDVLVTRFRAGPVFYRAWRESKTIGTLSWLLNVHVTGVFASPMDQILHFPGFENHVVSVTNYTGETRDYLKKLITLMGGEFTPSLSPKNTVLVAAHQSGSKTAKAAEWSIPVVHHLWLEDCFLRWQALTPALEKYVSYPAGRGVGTDVKERIDEEAARDAEESEEAEEERARAEGEGEDTSEGADDDPRHHHDSQASADESEVEGGLMPALDVDVDGDVDMDRDVDVDMDSGGGWDGDNTLDDVREDRDAGDRMSEDEPSTPKTTPAKPKSKPKSPSTPAGAKPKSSLKKAGTRGRQLRSCASRADESAQGCGGVYVYAEKNSQRKAREETDSESSEEADEDDAPAARRAQRNLVRRVSGPAASRQSLLKSPRSALSEKAATPRKLRALADSDLDDEDDFPAVLTAFAPAPELKSKPKSTKKPPVRAAAPPSSASASATASTSTSHVPPKRQLAAKKQKIVEKSPRNVAATPTPPSSPLPPATPSPRAWRHVPKAELSVEVHTSKTSLRRRGRHRRRWGRHRLQVWLLWRAMRLHRTRGRRTARAASPASSVSAAPQNQSPNGIGGGRAKRSAAVAATQRLHDKIMPDVVNYQNEMRNRGRKGARRVSGRGDEEESENPDDEKPSKKRRKVEDGKRGESGVDERRREPKARKSELALRLG
ncbi:hypothetical protein B0H14DRAFT_2871867 [Mycena olivaceomarginata]|nr:hypothetical protein B0H14DRAFT_2871867 [Mycena olivaceomarginata]